MSAIDALSRAEIDAALAGPPTARAAFLRAAAECGHAEAQAVLGQMLLDGVGCEADPHEAFRWFNRAAAQHHVMALNMVGRCYELGWGVRVDAERAASCYRIAADRGLVEAMYNFATMLALGSGVTMDRAEALRLFERAADLGYAKAVNHVGSFAEDGWACEVDLGKAARCYERAAAAGDFRGQFNHARMLALAGRSRDALPWIAKAAHGGTDAFRSKLTAWLSGHDDEVLRAEGARLVELAC